MEVDVESKKRQKEAEATLSSVTRQSKTKENTEDKDDKEETAKRELFPSAPAEYRTFYTKEQNRGK
jgi:hypothetical protein